MANNQSSWKWFGLFLVSLVGYMVALVAIPIQIVYRIFSKKYHLSYYWKQLAVGNDVLAGSAIYGSKHTVSAITGEKSHRDSKWHEFQEAFIDYFFGKNHCYLEAVDEGLIANPDPAIKLGKALFLELLEKIKNKIIGIVT